MMLTCGFLTKPPVSSLLAIFFSASATGKFITLTWPISGKVMSPASLTRVSTPRSRLPYTEIFSTSPAPSKTSPALALPTVKASSVVIINSISRFIISSISSVTRFTKYRWRSARLLQAGDTTFGGARTCRGCPGSARGCSASSGRCGLVQVLNLGSRAQAVHFLLGAILGAGIDQVLLDLRCSHGQGQRHILDVDDGHQHRTLALIDDEQLALRHALQLGTQFRRQISAGTRHLTTGKAHLVAIHPGRHFLQRLALVDHLLECIVHVLAGDQQLAHVELLAIAEQFRVFVEILFHFRLGRAGNRAQFLLHVGLAADQRLGPLDGLHDFRVAVQLVFHRGIFHHLAIDQRFQQLLAGSFLLRRRHAGALQFLIQLQRRDFFTIHAGKRLARLLRLVAATGSQASHSQQDDASAQDTLLQISSFHFHRACHLRGFNQTLPHRWERRHQKIYACTWFQDAILQPIMKFACATGTNYATRLQKLQMMQSLFYSQYESRTPDRSWSCRHATMCIHAAIESIPAPAASAISVHFHASTPLVPYAPRSTNRAIATSCADSPGRNARALPSCRVFPSRRASHSLAPSP